MSEAIRGQLERALTARKAIFIVGAGVTIATTGSPELSWIGLVRSGIRRAADLKPSLSGEWHERQLQLCDGGDLRDLLAVAHDVRRELEELPGGQFANWLADTVGSITFDRDAPIPQLLGSFGVPIATTNYDDILVQTTGRSVATWDNARLWQSEFRDPGQYVIHLHGHWQRPESVIFGYDDYSRVIGDQISQQLLRGFSTLSQVIIVGMGEGVHDPNFSGLGNWLSAVARDNDRPPVLLVRESELQVAQRYGTQVGFLAASYGAEHEDLGIFLSDMARQTGRGSTAETNVIGWEVLSNKLRRLARRIEKGYSPDFVLSMSGPGNFASAMCLSHWDSDPPLLTAITFPKLPTPSAAALSFAKVAESCNYELIETSRWLIYVPDAVRHFAKGSRALVLDDRVIGGNSQARAKKLLAGLGYDVRTAALVVSPESRMMVDFYEEVIDGDFVFPWGGRYGRNEPPLR